MLPRFKDTTAFVLRTATFSMPHSMDGGYQGLGAKPSKIQPNMAVIRNVKCTLMITVIGWANL